MRVEPHLVADPGAVGAAAAELIHRRIAERGAGRFVLGCPGGRSPLTTYAALARLVSAAGTDLHRLVVVMMDEYVQPGVHGPTAEDAGSLHSCRRFGQVEIVERLNAGLPGSHRIPPENLWVPDPQQPDDYEARLADAGGVDVFVLASGASDGHIAFNPPGSQAQSRSRVVDLPDSTRRDNLATFPSFEGQLDRVPRQGVTVGIATIREHSREVVMVVHGKDKQRAAGRLVGAQAYDPSWPATVLSDCRNPHLIVDVAAAGRAIAMASSHH